MIFRNSSENPTTPIETAVKLDTLQTSAHYEGCLRLLTEHEDIADKFKLFKNNPEVIEAVYFILSNREVLSARELEARIVEAMNSKIGSIFLDIDAAGDDRFNLAA